jgi:hypothetical protein
MTRFPDPTGFPDPARPHPSVGAPPGSRRAALILTVVVLAVVALLAGLATVWLTAPSNDPNDPTGPTGTPPRTTAAGPTSVGEGGGWDLAGQAGLATRPMPVLPAAAALPHPLSAAAASAPIRLPAPAPAAGGGLVPRGFPASPEGALAQLAALTDAGLQGGDPQAYAVVYAAVAGPAAPPVAATPLYRGLVEIRARAGLPAAGAVAELLFEWAPTSGLIKGTTDRGRYVVACVLGQLDAGTGGRVISSGAGDCQALRWVDGRWEISPGPAAAPAPLAWPGSKEAARVGYRALTFSEGAVPEGAVSDAG